MGFKSRKPRIIWKESPMNPPGYVGRIVGSKEFLWSIHVSKHTFRWAKQPFVCWGYYVSTKALWRAESVDIVKRRSDDFWQGHSYETAEEAKADAEIVITRNYPKYRNRSYKF